VHRLQMMRRSADFDITDQIITYYQGDDYINQVMEDSVHSDFIKQETLSWELIKGEPAPEAFTEKHKIVGYEFTLGVLKKEGN